MKQGSPRKTAPKRNAQETRQRLLEAARREFARRGLEGARVEDVIAGAGVSKQVLFYHFGSKESLYVEVLKESHERFRSRDDELDPTIDDPVEAIRRLVIFTFDHVRDNQDFVRLLADENLHGGRHLASMRDIADLYTPLIGRIRTILERGERRGLFRSGIDPHHFYISMGALAFFYFSNAHTLGAAFERDFARPDEIDRRREHVINFVLDAIRHPNAAATDQRAGGRRPTKRSPGAPRTADRDGSLTTRESGPAEDAPRAAAPPTRRGSGASSPRRAKARSPEGRSAARSTSGRKGRTRPDGPSG